MVLELFPIVCSFYVNFWKFLDCSFSEIFWKFLVYSFCGNSRKFLECSSFLGSEMFN